MLFPLLVVLYIPEVEKVFREIEKIFSYRLYRGLSPIWGRLFSCGAGRSSARTRGGPATSKVQQEYLFQADIAGVSGLEKGSHSRRLQHG